MAARTPLGAKWEKKLADMSRSKKEQKDEYAQPAKTAKSYPYGTRIDLDEGSHQKLGVKGALTSGDEYTVTAHARVTNAGQNQDDGGAPRRNATLQITHMSMAPKAKGAASANPLDAAKSPNTSRAAKRAPVLGAKGNK